MNLHHTFPPKKILVPTDLSTASESALKYARYFNKHFRSEVIVLHAHHFELPPYFSSSQINDLKRELKRLGRAAERYVREQSEPVLGFPPQVRVVENPPSEAILEMARDDGYELVIMGMHGRRGLERLWLGSVTERVLRHSSLPVLAVRNPPSEEPFQRLLCPVSVSDAGKQALEYSACISRSTGSHITVLHVVEEGQQPLDCPLVGEEIKQSCNVEETILKGNAARTIVEASINLKPDALVMGAEHKPTLLGELFSSTTESVMQLAAVPLLVVPKKD